jgi:RHS repeat-associated protein
MTDSSGTAQTSYTYEPFGKATAAGAADPNTLQFTGRENDGTGLQYNRARYYSPALQRFISQDPLGFGGGDVNTYAYTGNSPTNLTDPSGEFAFLIPMAIGCVSMAAFSIGWDLVSAKLTGRKLDVGGMLRDAGIACVTGALGGFLGEIGGALVARIAGQVATKDASVGLSFTERQLQSQLAQHGDVWGIDGVPNTSATRAEFLSRLVDHIDDAGTTRIEGTFRGQRVVHYVNDHGLNVFTTPEGGFWGAWRLNAEQLSNVLMRGSL